MRDAPWTAPDPLRPLPANRRCDDSGPISMVFQPLNTGQMPVLAASDRSGLGKCLCNLLLLMLADGGADEFGDGREGGVVEDHRRVDVDVEMEFDVTDEADRVDRVDAHLGERDH